MATVAKPISRIDWQQFEQLYASLEADAFAVIDATLPNQQGKTRVLRSADMRFVGQGFEVATTLPAGPYTAASRETFESAFRAAYRQTFSQVLPVGEIEIVNIRIAMSVEATSSGLASTAVAAAAGGALQSHRQVWVGARKCYEEVPVYLRDRLAAGESIEGPALVQEASSTLVLPAAAKARVDGFGSLIIDLAPVGETASAEGACAPAVNS
jgi:N-methylhydantoinase A